MSLSTQLTQSSEGSRVVVSDLSGEFVEIVLASFAPDLEFFLEQIKSLQQQTWSRWHCHVVDDGSPKELIAQMQVCFQGDERFTLYVLAENVGAFRNFERGLKLCSDRATAIAFCDQDDIWLPQKLKRLLAELLRQQAVLVHSDLEAIDGFGNTLQPSCWEFEERTPEAATVPLLLMQNTVTGCSCLF